MRVEVPPSGFFATSPFPHQKSSLAALILADLPSFSGSRAYRRSRRKERYPPAPPRRKTHQPPDSARNALENPPQESLIPYRDGVRGADRKRPRVRGRQGESPA